MHYTPPTVKAFLSGDEQTASRSEQLGLWPLYLFTAVVGLLTVPETIYEITGIEYFQGWAVSYGERTIGMALLAAFLGGLRILYVTLEGLLAGKVGADLAVAIASVAAIVLGKTWIAAEVVFISLLGECLEAFIFTRFTRELRAILELAPQVAHVVRSGVEVNVPVDELAPGDVVIVRPGERVPVDGTVTGGSSDVDESSLTGESLPRDKQPGDPVFTGTLNGFGSLELRAEKVGAQTTLGQILRLVGEAQQRKAPLERKADQYARLFLPMVAVVAGLTFAWTNYGAAEWVWEPMLAVLVVACPCPLVLATPAATLGAMAWLAHRGVVMKGSIALERLATVDHLVFDKTGTLTEARLRLDAIHPGDGTDEAWLLCAAASAEARSEHPLARLVTEAAGSRQIAPWPVAEFRYEPGAGVVVQIDVAAAEAIESPSYAPTSIAVGNTRLLKSLGIEVPQAFVEQLAEQDARGRTSLLVAVDGSVRGLLAASDTIRPEAAEVLAELRGLGIRRMSLLTGDRESAARHVSEALGQFDDVAAGQLPADKASWIESQQSGPAAARIGMIGDGVNDAPALATADVGMALGGVGSDLAAEAGDLVLLGDPLRPLPGLVRLARQTVRIIQQNILIFAFGVNGMAFVLANVPWKGAYLLSPVAAVLYHLGGSVLVLANSMRLLWFERSDDFWLVRGANAVIGTLDGWGEALSLPSLVRFAENYGSRILKVAAAGILLWWACWNIHIIAPDEQALVLRCGRFRTELGPGLAWRLPYPLETVIRSRPDEIRTLEIGLRSPPLEVQTASEWSTVHGSGSLARLPEESLLLTGDEVFVEVAASVSYRVASGELRTYELAVAEPAGILRATTEHALRVTAARYTLEEFLTSERATIEAEVLSQVRQLASEYELGVEVVDVALSDVHPPLEVVPFFRDVANAYERRHELINEAEANYQRTVLSAGGQELVAQLRELRTADGDLSISPARWKTLLELAGGSAADLLNAAQTRRVQRTELASGEAGRFTLRQQAFRNAPWVTQTRMFWETAQRVLSGKQTLILDPKVVGRRRVFLSDPESFLPPMLPRIAPADDEFDPRLLPMPDESGEES